MKKLFFLFALAIGASFGTQAQQISPNALGLRFGAGNGLGTEISYQMAMGANRLELDLGLNSNDNYDRFALTGVYQWVWNLEGNFNWYAGVGATIGSWSYNENFAGANEGGFNAGATGQLGIEYNFNIPLQLSLDVRPNFWLLDDAGFDWNGLALGVRYQF